MTRADFPAVTEELPDYGVAFVAERERRVYCSKACAYAQAADCEDVVEKRFRVVGVLNDKALSQLALRRLRCDWCGKPIHPVEHLP